MIFSPLRAPLARPGGTRIVKCVATRIVRSIASFASRRVASSDVDVRARRVDDLARLYALAGRPVAPGRVPSRRSMSRPRATRRRVARAAVARAREDARGGRRISGHDRAYE
jgi:hypothetical protein